MATHRTENKFQVLLTQLKYWKGLASVAVFIETKEDTDVFYEFNIKKNRINSPLKASTFHLVLEKSDMRYPHNNLRNVAMEAAESDYVLPIDAEFIPLPEGCHERLLAALKSPSSPLLVNKQRLFVLPAFELKPQQGTNKTRASESQLPVSKFDLLEKLKTKEATPFHFDVFERGHGPTNFTKWVNLPPSMDETFYDIPNDRRVMDGAFEPYVMAFKSGLPKYW